MCARERERVIIQQLKHLSAESALKLSDFRTVRCMVKAWLSSEGVLGDSCSFFNNFFGLFVFGLYGTLFGLGLASL